MLLVRTTVRASELHGLGLFADGAASTADVHEAGAPETMSASLRIPDLSRTSREVRNVAVQVEPTT
jgi:hypothetical protein